MEGLGAEVSAKIRSAIKAKLIELEAYVDDELPDYIMVMVANNRTKEQMEEDLGLFLNNNCGAFTNWLHAVLEKLKKVTLEEVSKKDSKKKRVKKVVDKSVKKNVKDKVKDSGKERDRKSKSEKSERRTKSSHKVGSEKNANLEELGERKKSKQVSLDDSGGKDGYNPASMLKSAIDKNKKKSSPKKSPKKTRKESRCDSDHEAEKSKTIINLREEAEFYNDGRKERHGLNFEIKKRGESSIKRSAETQKERSRSPNRTYGYNIYKSGGGDRKRGISSLVSKVVKPHRSDRPRSRSLSSVSDISYDPEMVLKKSLVSKAMIPPRPRRPAGREEKGVARAVNRAIMDADRSIMRNKRRDSREREMDQHPRDIDIRRHTNPRDRDIRWEGRDQNYRDRDIRGRKSFEDVRRQRQERPHKVSPEELRHYSNFRGRHDDMYARNYHQDIKDQRQRERDVRDRHREETARLSRRANELKRDMESRDRRLAMDVEIEKNIRASSLDRTLLKKREERRDRAEEEMRIIIRRDESASRELSPITPPKKRKLEDDDAELLEMRRKALESLMKRTDRELGKRRGSSKDRKILIPLGDVSTEDESDETDTSESEESDISLSDVEGVEEQKEDKNNSSKAEPTFIVTMDGIDDKYFKKSNIVEKEVVVSTPIERKSTEANSKCSSDAELELHPNEEFDEIPKKKVYSPPSGTKLAQKSDNKTLVSHNGTSVKPTMKVAARKRSPILPPADNPQKQPVATIKPIQVAKSSGKTGGSNASKLAATYAAKLSAIKAAKAEAAKAGNATKTSSAPLSPAVRIKTVPVKPSKSEAEIKPKVKRKPIKAPTPEPADKSVGGINRLHSAPADLSFTFKNSPTSITKSSSTCKFWPNCARKSSCAFYHPPMDGPKSVDALSSNKYKWSAS